MEKFKFVFFNYDSFTSSTNGQGGETVKNSDGSYTFTITSPTVGNNNMAITIDSSLPVGHVLYWSFDTKSNSNAIVHPWFGTYAYTESLNFNNMQTTDEYKHYAAIRKNIGTFAYYHPVIYFGNIRGNVGANVTINNTIFIDLTETYGAGNEPSDVNQVKEDLHL